MCYSAENDITKKAVQQDAWLLATQSDCCMVGLEPVCASWSAARRAPAWSEMPHRFRTTGRCLFDLPGMTDKERGHVWAGNAMYRHIMDVVEYCTRAGISGY